MGPAPARIQGRRVVNPSGHSGLGQVKDESASECAPWSPKIMTLIGAITGTEFTQLGLDFGGGGDVKGATKNCEWKGDEKPFEAVVQGCIARRRYFKAPGHGNLVRFTWNVRVGSSRAGGGAL